MGQVTLAELRTAAKQAADMEGSTFVSDSEWNSYINREAAQLHNEVSTTYEDYFITETTFTLDGSTNTVSLPSDFWKIRGLDYQIDAGAQTWRDVRQFSFIRRNDLTPDIRRLWGTAPERRYRVYGNAIWIIPERDCSGTYRLWYLRLYQPMVSDSDAIEDWEGCHELVILGAAIRALKKEESLETAASLEGERERLRARIAASFQNRNAGEPEVVQDVQSTSSLTPYGGYPWV